jgi:EmrB/QacA subfamily drug resistance transporter
MYLAVTAAIAGQALLLGRLELGVYAAAAWAVMAAFSRWYEQPLLARRFGADYETYRRSVPAWVPRRSPDAVAPQRAPWTVLAVLCLAVFTINLDTTIVNVALPALVRQLGASTRQLQWVVDAYNLVFAALVLAAGSLSDRYGRRGALVTGLVVFGLASTVGALSSSTASLISARAVMGVGAALIFPATLSILSNVFTERRARAKAIGAWGASTGLGVAFGPITGGWLLEHFWWGSCFLLMGPVAASAIVLVLRIVPTSKDPDAPRLDFGGLAGSTAAVGLLIYTIIEAPDRGWTDPVSLAGFAGAAVLFAGFVRWERRSRQPMLDVGMFRNLRFTAASGSVTVAFFALFGFIFLITQYFQFVKGYTPLSTGVRLLPVAGSIAIASVVGTRLTVSVGNKAVIAGGLGALAIAYVWISTASAATGYPEITAQMLLLGGGMGLTGPAATEAILGVVPKEKAGIGSAINDATREFGGTLGVAVIGSVFASLYGAALHTPAVSALPAPAVTAAGEGIGGAYIAAGRLSAAGLPPPAVERFLDVARDGFFDGLAAGCLVAAGVALAGAVFAAAVLPNQPQVGGLDVEDAQLPVRSS